MAKNGTLRISTAPAGDRTPVGVFPVCGHPCGQGKGTPQESLEIVRMKRPLMEVLPDLRAVYQGARFSVETNKQPLKFYVTDSKKTSRICRPITSRFTLLRDLVPEKQIIPSVVIVKLSSQIHFHPDAKVGWM